MLMVAVSLLALPDGPWDATFLTSAQKDWLERTIAAEDRSGGIGENVNPLTALADGRGLLLAAPSHSFSLAAHGLGIGCRPLSSASVWQRRKTASSTCCRGS